MTLANILSTSLFPFGSGNRVMGVEVCGLGQPVKCVSSIISMLMVTLMAVDRWRSITTNPVTGSSYFFSFLSFVIKIIWEHR
ncbi:unnamed protein product [Oikopleura dioica]|uniref:Uncharacterized protein n=1 Tax=Oikopleura dioica TaxID=34765 RepID=E4WSZ6_OIKDI|nr:unnamed protein product [Oikopleura dioica]